MLTATQKNTYRESETTQKLKGKKDTLLFANVLTVFSNRCRVCRPAISSTACNADAMPPVFRRRRLGYCGETCPYRPRYHIQRTHSIPTENLLRPYQPIHTKRARGQKGNHARGASLVVVVVAVRPHRMVPLSLSTSNPYPGM